MIAISEFFVALFSDEPLALGALQALLGSSAGLRVVAAESQTASLIEAVRDRKPEVVLVDLSPDADLGIVRDLQQAAPGSKVVLWTRGVAMEVAWHAVELGIKGILLKTLAPELLVKCLHRVAAGELWLDSSLTKVMLTSRPVRLTPRESQLVVLLARGLKNKEIAAELSISEGTVKVYLSKLFEKVGAKDRFELALFGLKYLKSLTATPATATLPYTMRSMMMHRTA
jgi:two-component system, NarL family, nitrate/nitrite response regulator NarL